MGNAWASWKHSFQSGETQSTGQGVALWGGYSPLPWGFGEEQPGPCRLSLWGPVLHGGGRCRARQGRSAMGMLVTPSAGTGLRWCVVLLLSAQQTVGRGLGIPAMNPPTEGGLARRGLCLLRDAEASSCAPSRSDVSVWPPGGGQCRHPRPGPGPAPHSSVGLGEC